MASDWETLLGDPSWEPGLGDPTETEDEPLDSRVMEARDRLACIGLFAAAVLVFGLALLVAQTRDPLVDPAAGYVGALLLGLAAGLLSTMLFWLGVFARHRRIAYRGDWARAIRRGGWVFLVTALFVVLRLNQVFSPEIGLFILALVVVAEATLSVER
jgi:hypothetical protein